MRAPDSVGRDDRVKVWRINRTDEARTTLAYWLLEGPFHPLWNHWAISIIHLRDVDGLPPAYRQFPEASHELMMVSLNPERTEWDVDRFEETGHWGDPDDKRALYLSPIDQQVQWSDTTDEEAVEIGELAVQAILDGFASPDQDWRSWWTRAIASALDHRKTGGTHMPPMPEGRA